MRKYEGKVVGILGTVILHLIAAIIFMSFQISSLKVEQQDMFTVEFDPVEETAKQDNIIQLPGSNIERILQGDQEMLNIARNLANKPDDKIDPSDYIDKVKEELIRDGKLGIDNYIDEQKKTDEMKGDENLAVEKKNDETVIKEPKESDKMAANFQGPTRIYYDLKGRNHTYLPVPVYKCQVSGKVVLSIMVNQKGVVEEARIVEGESTTSDICLTEAAIATALISRFNADINSPKIQTGSLTYHFVAQ